MSIAQRDPEECTTRQWLKKVELSLKNGDGMGAIQYLMLAEERAGSDGESEAADIIGNATGYLMIDRVEECMDTVDEAREEL